MGTKSRSNARSAQNRPERASVQWAVESVSGNSIQDLSSVRAGGQSASTPPSERFQPFVPKPMHKTFVKTALERVNHNRGRVERAVERNRLDADFTCFAGRERETGELRLCGQHDRVEFLNRAVVYPKHARRQ